jgi:hypothetical protein
MLIIPLNKYSLNDGFCDEEEISLIILIGLLLLISLLIIIVNFINTREMYN